MPRPHIPRHVHALPEATYFKPRGIPLRELDEIVVGLDEFEEMLGAIAEKSKHVSGNSPPRSQSSQRKD